MNTNCEATKLVDDDLTSNKGGINFATFLKRREIFQASHKPTTIIIN